MEKQQVKAYAKAIQKEYETQDLTDYEKLKKLHSKVKTMPFVFAMTVGVIGTLIFGAGMCFAMSVIGNSTVLGVVLGLVGIVIVSVNYPIYKRLINGRKEKYSAEILALSEKIINS